MEKGRKVRDYRDEKGQVEFYNFKKEVKLDLISKKEVVINDL